MIFVDYPGHLLAGALLVIAGALVVLAYRARSIENLKGWRWILGMLQYLAVVILLIILWNPSRPLNVDTSVRNNVLVLFDTSKSMSVGDMNGRARLDKAVEVFNHHFEPGEPNYPEYRIYGFDSTCYTSSSISGLRKWGTQTNFQKLLGLLGKFDTPPSTAGGINAFNQNGNVAGAVVFTDGQADDKDLSAYLSLQEPRFKVVWVGMGTADRRSDLAVTSIKAPSRVLVDSVFAVEVQISAHRPPDRHINVDLYCDDTLVASRDASAGAIGENMTLKFQIPAHTLGNHYLMARIGGIENETNLANNLRHTLFEVIDVGKTKVLFYSQVASFDIGKIREVLERDKKIQLSFGLDAIIPPTLSRSPRAMSGHIKLPQKKSEFYEYDVIIFGPCSLDRLSPEQIDGLYSFVVDRGGGLIFLPGRSEFDIAACSKEKIKTLLPVEFNLTGNSKEPPERTLHLTLEGLESDILTEEDLKTNPAQATPYYEGLIKKPAASVLADSGDSPIACVHRVGRGRVALINMYGLFRWYREDLQGGVLHKFMSGLTAYVGRISRSEAGVRLFARRSTSQPQNIIFEADVSDRDFNPVTGATVLLTMEKKGPIRMAPIDKGRYVVEIDTLPNEAILAKVEAELNGVFLGEKHLAINLPLPKMEMDQVELDKDFLKGLAKKTHGVYIDADKVTGTIAHTFETNTKVKKFSHMTSIWPRWSLFVGLCIILSTQWFLRRILGLV